ncbi:MAG: hypothetical protein ACRC2O_08420 [Chitinophagaceae bacterium]
MKKIIYTLSALFMIGLAGCFNVTDELFLEEKGSGTFQTTMDMSGMKDMLNMLKTMMPDSLKDKSEGMEGLGALDSLETMWKELETIPGISEVKRVKKEEMVFTVSFRFENIKALNAAMAARNKKDSGYTAPKMDFYSFKKGQLICNDTSMAGIGDAMKEISGEKSKEDASGMDLSMLKTMMGDMKFTTIYHLPGKITDYTNKSAKLGEDGKTISLEINLSESDRVQTLQNDIKYK